jgi:multisubunit Na+/H+ antiporter MnhG subunit
MPLLIAYIGTAFLTAFLGRKTKLGFFWIFVLALLLTPITPILGFLIKRALLKRSLRKAQRLVAAHEAKLRGRAEL